MDLVGRMTSEARAVLALNPGSSSLKAAVRDPTLRLAVHVERLGTDKARATLSAPGKEPASTPVSGDFGDAVAWVRAVMEQLDDLVSRLERELSALARSARS